jgi:hypothetical protein
MQKYSFTGNHFKITVKGSNNGAFVAVSCTVTLDIAHCLGYFLKAQSFVGWICLHQVKGRRRDAYTLVGPLDRASLHHWTLTEV